jgi:K+-transporting ATPase KdpF subunit
MEFESAAALVLAVLLLVYLFVALLRPERFG